MAPNFELSTGLALAISQNRDTERHSDGVRFFSNQPHSHMVAHGGATLQNRWNDAETTAPTHDWKHGADRNRAWSPSAAFAASRMDRPFRHGRRCGRNDFLTSGNHRHGRSNFLTSGKWFTGLRETAATTMAASAGGVESNKGVSEDLSALAGKSVRVRRESPSKAPKNRSRMVSWPIRPRRRNWQGVR